MLACFDSAVESLFNHDLLDPWIKLLVLCIITLDRALIIMAILDPHVNALFAEGRLAKRALQWIQKHLEADATREIIVDFFAVVGVLLVQEIMHVY